MTKNHIHFILLALFCLLLVTHPISAQDESPDLAALVAGNNVFAFDLYQAIRAEEDGNLFFSPYSISQALAMIYAGARGDTASQMSDTLHFSLPQETLHPTFGALTADFNARAEQELAPDDEEQRFQLNVANALWGQDGFAFLPDFLKTLDDNYEAGLETVDFFSDPEAAREMINDWVEEATEDKIQDIVPEGAITPDTRLVLANAIYFKAGWLRTFSEEATEDGTFFLLDGGEVTVPMMRQQETLLYAAGEGYQAVMLPYYGGELGMMLILPDEGTFETVDEALDAEMFDALAAEMAYNQIRLTMPKFEFEFGLELADMLAGMGMADAFTEAADFSGIAEEALAISRVLHKAFVSVDENGTEAAAATILMMEATSAQPEEPIEVRLDRPFIFAIYDQTTGTILFVGRVMNPTR